jgi:hypothetical protein
MFNALQAADKVIFAANEMSGVKAITKIEKQSPRHSPLRSSRVSRHPHAADGSIWVEAFSFRFSGVRI